MRKDTVIQTFSMQQQCFGFRDPAESKCRSGSGRFFLKNKKIKIYIKIGREREMVLSGKSGIFG